MVKVRTNRGRLPGTKMVARFNWLGVSQFPKPSRDRQEARELGVPGVRDHMYGYGDVQVLSESIRIIFGFEPPARQAQDSRFFLKLCGREQGSRSVERENGVRRAQGVGGPGRIFRCLRTRPSSWP
jgi:hypothetical protein